MLQVLKRISGFLEKQSKRIPWWMRGILSARRWYLGIKGTPALWALISSLVMSGGIVSFLDQIPLSAQLLWGTAGVLGIFGIAGHLGAQIRAKTGTITLLNDREFWDYANELVEDFAGYLVLVKFIEDTNTKATLYRQITLKEPKIEKDLFKGIRAPRSASQLTGEGLSVLKESEHRGFITDAERNQCRKGLESILKGLQLVVARIPQVTGLRGARPVSQLKSPPDID